MTKLSFVLKQFSCNSTYEIDLLRLSSFQNYCKERRWDFDEDSLVGGATYRLPSTTCSQERFIGDLSPLILSICTVHFPSHLPSDSISTGLDTITIIFRGTEDPCNFLEFPCYRDSILIYCICYLVLEYALCCLCIYCKFTYVTGNIHISKTISTGNIHISKTIVKIQLISTPMYQSSSLCDTLMLQFNPSLVSDAHLNDSDREVNARVLQKTPKKGLRSTAAINSSRSYCQRVFASFATQLILSYNCQRG